MEDERLKGEQDLRDRPEADRDGVVRLEGLRIGYRQGRKERLLSGPISCSAAKGELVVLMGRNGCGKSTLLRTLAGLQDSLGGGIILHERPMKSYGRKDLARLLAFVSTEAVRVQGLRVRDLVAMGRYPHTGWFGNLDAGDHEKVRLALELTSMEELGERDLDELSDGERQRAMIARTLAQDSLTLVLDEPTAFLDVTHRYEVISLLRDLSRKLGKTVVFSSHDLHLSLQAADKIWMMIGREVLEGAPEDLVLSGKLEEGLLKDSAGGGIVLDPATGDLVRPGEPGREISVHSGSRELGLWTSRSLERMGFRAVDDDGAQLRLRAGGEKGNLRWILEKSGRREEFNSIYELSLYLRTKV